MKYLFLLLFTILVYPQGVKISALAEAANITQDDLFVIVDSPGGTPVTKKITFTKVLDSIKASTLGYIILQDPFTREMDGETDRIYIPKFENPYFAWQTDFNSGMDKIDSAVKYFDPVYFEVNGDTVTATDEWNLIDTNNYPVLDSVYNHAGTASTTSSIYRAIERVNALKLNLSGGTLTGTLTGTTINATSGFQLNGTSINTTGTLTNVAYKGQDNGFLTTQTVLAIGGVGLIINNTAGNQSDMSYQRSGVSRWFLRMNSTSETGSNAGSDYEIVRRADDGSLLGTSMLIKRSNGYVRIGGGTIPSEALDVNGNIIASGTVTTSQFKLSALNTAPASATATGTTGEIRITATAIFICVATNTWVKANLATW